MLSVIVLLVNHFKSIVVLNSPHIISSIDARALMKAFFFVGLCVENLGV